MLNPSGSSQPQSIETDESSSNPSTSQLLAEFASKRSAPYGSIPPPNQHHSNQSSSSKSKFLSRASSTNKAHNRNSSSALITDSSSNTNSPSSSSASSSLNSHLSPPSDSRTLSQPSTPSTSSNSTKSRVPSTSAPADSKSSSPSVRSLYNSSRGRTRNVSPSSGWERRSTSANVSSPAASEDGDSTPNANSRVRNGILEGIDPSVTGKGKGKERERDVKGTPSKDDFDDRAISSSRERRRVENWIKRGDVRGEETQDTNVRMESSSRGKRRKGRDPSQKKPTSDHPPKSSPSSSTSPHKSSNELRRSSLLPPLSPPRSSESNVTFRNRSSTLVPLSSSTSSSSPTDFLTDASSSGNDQLLKADRALTPPLTRPHGALFSSDLDDEVLLSDSLSSDCSSESLTGEESEKSRASRRRFRPDGIDDEDDSEGDVDEGEDEEDYSISSTSACNSLISISNSRSPLSRSVSTSPNASSSRSGRNRIRGRVGRRETPIGEDSSSQTSSISPVKRACGVLASTGEGSTSRENVEGKDSRRRRRRISSVERGRRRELRVLLAPPSPAPNSDLGLESKGLDHDEYKDFSNPSRHEPRVSSREGTVADEDSDREVLEFKSRAQRRAGTHEAVSRPMPYLKIARTTDDLDTSFTSLPLSRSKSEGSAAHQPSTEAEAEAEASSSNQDHPDQTSGNLLNLGPLPGRAWLRNWSSSNLSSEPIGSESRSSSVPTLVSKPSLNSASSNFQRAARSRISTVPTFVPAEADPLGSNDPDDNNFNDFKEQLAVDDLIQVESVVYDGEEDSKVQAPTHSKRSWGKKFSSTVLKSSASSISSQTSQTPEAAGEPTPSSSQSKLNPNPTGRSSTLLSRNPSSNPVILSPQRSSRSRGLTTEEKLRRTSMNAANEQGFAAAYAARLANVGTNLWNWNRGTNHGREDRNPSHQRFGSTESVASEVGEGLESRPPNVGDTEIDPASHGNPGILASGWRNLTRLPNLILMPALSNPPAPATPMNRTGQETGRLDHPALDFLIPSPETNPAQDEGRNREILRAQHEIAARMGPPSSPSPPASPSFNQDSSSSSSLAETPHLSQAQSMDSSSGRVLGGESKRLSQEQPATRNSSHQHSSSTSSDSTVSTTQPSDGSRSRKVSMSTHSKGARGVLSAYEGDFDSGAYVSGLGQPIDPDTELSSVVHLQTFRSRSRDRRDRNEINNSSSTSPSSSRNSSRSFNPSNAQGPKQHRVSKSLSTSALDDEDAEEESETSIVGSSRGKRSSLDRINTSHGVEGKLSRREHTRSDGSETMSPNTLLFRHRSPSSSSAIGSATTSTTKKPILAEAQRANRDFASVSTSASTVSQYKSTQPYPTSSASESALAALAESKSNKILSAVPSERDQASTPLKHELAEEFKGPRRSASLIDFSEQRRFAAREEARKRELNEELNDRKDIEDRGGIPPNAISNLRTRQSRPLASKRARSYRPAAESPVGEGYCAFPISGSSTGEVEHSDPSLSSSNSSNSSTTSLSSLENESPGENFRGAVPREKKGNSRARSRRAGRRRDLSPTSSATRQCAVGLFSGRDSGDRRKSSPSRAKLQREARSSPNLPGLSIQAEKQKESSGADGKDPSKGRMGRRRSSRRGSNDEEDLHSSRAEDDGDRENRGRGRAGDVKVVSSSHGQTACQPYPLPFVSLGLRPAAASSRNRSTRNSPSRIDHSNASRRSNPRSGRILPRPSSAPNLGTVLLRASQSQNPHDTNDQTGTEQDQKFSSSPSHSITASTSAGELTCENFLDVQAQASSQIQHGPASSSSSDQQPRIPPARAPPLNSQAAQNQSQYLIPPPRPTLLSNGAHLLMLSLELEMIRKRKISAPLKPRWGKQRIRPGLNCSNPSTPMENSANGGSPSSSSTESVPMRKGSALKYEILS